MPIASRAMSFGYAGVAAVLLLVWFPYSPLQDFPEWIYQGYVFNEICSGQAAAQFFVKSYPVPYTMVQLFISGCLLIFSPMLTSKVFVAVYAAVSLWTSHRLITAYDMDKIVAWPVLLSIFILNGPFWSGYVGYQFGLNIFVLYLSLGERWRTDVRILVGLSVVSFLTHGMIFLAFVLAAGTFSLKQRRVHIFALSMVPSALLALWYVSKNVTPAVGGVPVVLHTAAEFAEYKAYTFLKLCPYHNWTISGVEYPALFAEARSICGAATNLVFVLGLAAYCLTNRRTAWRQTIRKPEVMLGALLVGMALVLSPTALGVGNPSERVLYPAFIALFAALGANRAASFPPFGLWARTAVSIAAIVGFTMSSAGLILAGISYDRHGATPRGASAAAPPLENDRRALFAHRMVQFDDRMRETERAWRTGTPPRLPLIFDTALLGQAR